MRQVTAEGLSGCLDEGTGRLLELVDTSTGLDVLLWRPALFELDEPRNLGGFGPFGAMFDGATWRFRRAARSLAMSAELSNGCQWRHRLTFDGASVRADLELTSPTDRSIVDQLSVALTAQPGHGGDWPRMKTGCLNNRQKVTVADRRGRLEEVYPTTIDGASYGFGDAAWVAVTDPASGQGIWAELATGSLGLYTEKAFDFTWTAPVALPPGARLRWTFRLAVFAGMDHPERVRNGWLGGCNGNRLVATDGHSPEPVHLRLFGDKPLPAGLTAPAWSPRSVPGHELTDLLARLGQLHAAADEPRARAVFASFAYRARMLALRRPAVQLAGVRALVAEAEKLTQAEQVYRSFYSQADLANMRRLAGGFDAQAKAAEIAGQLARPFVIDRPRLRCYDRSRSPFGQASLVSQAACLSAVCQDAELGQLAARRLAESFADAWRRFGIVCHETIHHGVLLSSLIPAYSLLADLGAFDSDPAGEAAVMAMFWDIADQIHRLRRDGQSVSNWHGMEQAGLTALAAILPGHPQTASRVEYALGQVENLLTKGVFADGMFWEQSMGYHQNVQTFMMRNAEAVLRCGRDIYAGQIGGRSIVELARLTAGMMMPDGSVPRFEDSSHHVNAGLLALYARRFADRELMSAAVRAGYTPAPADLVYPVEDISPAPAPERPRCRVFANTGRVTLAGAGAALVMDYGPHGGWHGDWDKMALELFDAHGPVICDPGTYRYEEALHWTHFKHTTSHSTVSLDDRRQLTCSGQLTDHTRHDADHSVTAEAGTYPNVTHRRTIRHAAGGFAVEDVLSGGFDAKEAVFRLTFPAPAKIEGNVVTTDRLEVCLSDVAANDRLEVVEVPIMPIDTATIHDEPHATGWQFRWRRRLNHADDQVRFACILHPQPPTA